MNNERMEIGMNEWKKIWTKEGETEKVKMRKGRKTKEMKEGN